MVDAKSEELDLLLAALVNGEVTPEQLARLEALLSDDPNAQRRYVQYLDLHAELVHRFIARVGQDSLSPVPRWSTRRVLLWLTPIATAAVILLAVIVWTGGPRKAANESATGIPAGNPISKELTDDGVAVLTLASNVRWASENAPHTGSILSPGTLKILGGILHIEFYSGARLVLEGPAELEVVSADLAICRSGKLRAHVPPPARGFTIKSQQFDLVDLGTEFGLDVQLDGTTRVQVFEGQVDLHPPGHPTPREVRRLVGGEGVQYDGRGHAKAVTLPPDAFPSLDAVPTLQKAAAEHRLKAWREWNDGLTKDSRVAFRFDFEGEGGRLLDRGPLASHGVIVGANWTSGRWPGKRALEFNRPGDRVRLNLPGEFDRLSVSAWLRVDSLTDRPQGILLTDGYEVGRLHWQISDAGSVRLGVRISSPAKTGATGYGSPVVFTPRNIGAWCFVTSVYDRTNRRVSHYFNGLEASTDPLVGDLPLSLGPCEIGNWGVPFGGRAHVIRNFVGRIDELTIWNTALSAEDVLSTYSTSRP